MAARSFDGEALAWFQWEDRRQRMVSLDELKSRLLVRFGFTQEGSLCEKFLALRQEGFVKEFSKNFEAMTSVLQGVPEHVPEGVSLMG